MVSKPVRSERLVPKTVITADIVRIISLKVAKAGYYGGNPAFVRQAPIDDVISILDYENFLGEYEFTEFKMNEKTP